MFRDVPRHKLALIFVLQLLYQIGMCELSMFSGSNLLCAVVLAGLSVLYVLV